MQRRTVTRYFSPDCSIQGAHRQERGVTRALSILTDLVALLPWDINAISAMCAAAPRLFELCSDQPRPLQVTERHGFAVLRLRAGATITPELIEELNQLIGDDYYKPRPEQLRRWLAGILDSLPNQLVARHRGETGGFTKDAAMKTLITARDHAPN